MHLIEDHAKKAEIPARFAATKLVEGDKLILQQLGLDRNEEETLEHMIHEIEEECAKDREAALADMRFKFIEKVCTQTVVKPTESKAHARSVKADKILTGKYTALPAFAAIMGLIFWLTFGVIGAGLSDWLSVGIDIVTDFADRALTAYGLNPVVHSLIIDGIFAGVGSVLSFLPIIVVLFFFLSILEDSGYMARIAFVMDKLLRKIGLSGRSFVPMIIGFGCSVPAIMATRTLSSERDRKMTILLTPFMSCSAKLPIYALFTYAFFPKYRALVMVGLYFTGIIVGVLFSLLLKNTAFQGEPVPFVMELPNYRLPSLKSVGMLIWDKAKDFITKAFTIIFMASIVIWFLQTFDVRLNVVVDSKDSLLALIGGFVTEDYLKEKIVELLKEGTELIVLDYKALLHFVEEVREYESQIQDVGIQAYLLNPLQSAYDYEDIARDYLRQMLPSRKEICGKKAIEEVFEAEEEKTVQMAAYLSYVPFHAYPLVIEKLKEQEMEELYLTIERPTVATLYDIEKYGITVEKDALKEYGDQLIGRIEELGQNIYEKAGKTFNINSPKQLGVILFEDLKMPFAKKTKTGYSTNADILEKLAPDYPIVSEILEYRQLTKLKSTYAC